VIAKSGIPYETSDTVMRIDDVPPRLAVIGGGYIAAEFAHVFSALGSTVTLVVRGGRLLKSHDETISHAYTDLAVRGSRIDVKLNTQVRAASKTESGITLALDDGETLEADVVLVAAGRIPNGDRMNLGAAGIGTHSDGRIEVDRFQRTTAEGVWALGDVSSPWQLKHVANREAKVVGHNVLHPDDLIEIDHRYVPSAVFTDPQVASVGKTEEQCRTIGVDYAVKVQRFGDVAFGWAMEDTTSLCKVIAEKGTGRLLGAHLMGPEASSLIQPLIQAMSFGLSAREMATGQYWIHPALPEVVENALLGLDL
jgi:mycothione reductase